MDELKLLVEMVSGLPTLTVWVLAGYLIYKLAVIGSVYGLIRFTVLHLYKYLAKVEVDVLHKIKHHNMAEAMAAKLEAELSSLVGIRSGSKTYYHAQDIQWILDAIAEKREKDKVA